MDNINLDESEAVGFCPLLDNPKGKILKRIFECRSLQKLGN